MNDNFDDEERINLALNSDFDSALLNCLEDDDDRDNDDLGGDTSDFSQSPMARPSTPVETHMPRLPSFLLNDNGNNVVAGSTSSVNGDPLVMDGSSPLEAAATTTATPGNPLYVNNNANHNANVATTTTTTPATNQAVPAQMHPLAIPSSASCPPVNNINYNNSNNTVPGSNPNNNNNNMGGLPGLADPNMAAALQAAFAASFMQFNSNPAFNPALIPLAYNALAAGVDLSNFLPQFQPPTTTYPMTTSTTGQQQEAPSQATPPLPTTGGGGGGAFSHPAPPGVVSITATSMSQPHSSMQENRHSTKKSTSKSSGNKSSKRRRSGQSGSSSSKRSKSSSSSNSLPKQQPPFQIFDAPVELRQNFIQSQRAHGLPVLEDNNSYHFGMTVNGFHPQRSLEEPFMYKSLNAKRPLPDPVPVVDARHADAGSKRLKNAKEQKRAHRISELIDQLRVKMEKGGWKVGIKSKFHTLSSCSDYVRHLIKINKEREEAVAKAKKDLEAKQAKMEEEKRTQQDPSEPESTTSSLTVSSRSEQADKKKAPSEYHEGQLATEKPRHLESHESTVSSGSSVSKQAPQSFSLGATSTVSDITSSKEGSLLKTTDAQESDETTCSDAAVASKGETRSSRRRHKDVVVAVSNKSESVRSATQPSVTSEKTSLDSDFKLDYEEVFLKSNVPQILAATNGRIVSFNDFFLKVTGLSKKEVDCLTIFSLVQTSLLSNLFEIVAAALRSSTEEEKDTEEKEKQEVTDEESGTKERKLTPLKDYAAITLPCVDFATAFRDEARSVSSQSQRQLYMTVTLMTDSDVTKRCFHCAFTDCPGTKGALGTVTPELLSALFTRTQSPAPTLQPDAEDDDTKPQAEQQGETPVKEETSDD